MEYLNAAIKQWAKYLLLTFAAISPQAFSANYITSLTVINNVIYFTTEEDKKKPVPDCAFFEDPQKWSVSSNVTNGLYDLLYIAKTNNQPIEIESADDCALDSVTERASAVKVNYEYSATPAATIASNLNFVARTTVEMAEGEVLDSVTFTLTNSAGTPNQQSATPENGYYIHDFGVLAQGSYTLKIHATSGEDTQEEIIPFNVATVAMEGDPVVYQVEGGAYTLYVKIPDRLGGQYMKIIKGTGGWEAEEIFPTQVEWSIYAQNESNYNIEFGDFLGDMLNDFRLVRNADFTEILVENLGNEYQVKNPIIVEYEYDALGRLIIVLDANNGDRGYDYDKAGNRITAGSK